MRLPALTQDKDKGPAGAGEGEDEEEIGPPIELKPTLRKANAVTVKCFWGDARWGRTQLLGEIARGGWGMYS